MSAPKVSDCSPASLRPSKVPEPRYPSLKVVVLDHHPFQKACANYLTLELTRPQGNTRVWHQAPMRRCHPRVTKGAKKKQTEGKRNARTEAEKSNKTKEKKQKRAKGNKTRTVKETSNKTKEKGTEKRSKRRKKEQTK